MPPTADDGPGYETWEDTPHRPRTANGNLSFPWGYARAAVFRNPYGPGWKYIVKDVRKGPRRKPDRYSEVFPTEDEAFNAAMKDLRG